MDRFVNWKVSSVMYHLCALRQIRPCLSLQLANDIGRAIVLSRLDYWNSLLVGSSEQVCNKLLRLQNNVARIVMNSTTCTHSQDLLEWFHLLPVREKVIFKMATMIYTASSCGEPAYLAEIITLHTSAGSLRSSDDSLKLVEPRVHTSLAGRRFSCAGPNI